MEDVCVLDSNSIIYLLGGNKSVVKICDNKEHYVSEISEIEVLGFSFEDENDQKKAEYYFSFTRSISINSFIKELAISLRRKYKLKLGDSIICATAIYLDYSLITADDRLKKVKELRLILFKP
jgi:predicted nucleic acid-binding protein